MLHELSSEGNDLMEECLQAAGQRDWSLPDSHQTQLEGDKELYVGGVHVHIFLKDPHFPLRNPKVPLLPTDPILGSHTFKPSDAS